MCVGRTAATTGASPSVTVVPAGAWARGVTPYLPLNLESEIEAQIERVLILTDKPVMRRPIAAATVLDALPKACQVDRALCQRVGRYLARCTHSSDLTHASIEGGATHGADDTLADRYVPTGSAPAGDGQNLRDT
jgi:hypothetical protein